MTDEQISASDEAGSTPVVVRVDAEAKEASRSFLASARKDLSEEELSAPAVRRFLIWEVERLERRVSELQSVERDYHSLRVKNATVEEKLKGAKLNDILSILCVSAGSAGIGAASKYLPLDVTTGSVLLAVSVVLLIAGIVAKVLK